MNKIAINESRSSVTGSPICRTNFNTIYGIWTILLNPRLKLLLTSLIYWKRKVLLVPVEPNQPLTIISDALQLLY